MTSREQGQKKIIRFVQVLRLLSLFFCGIDRWYNFGALFLQLIDEISVKDKTALSGSSENSGGTPKEKDIINAL